MRRPLSIRFPRWPFKRFRTKKCYTDRLTPDVLHQIFIESLEDNIYGPCSSLDETPLNVSQVCRTWRTIVLGSPLLWSALRVGSLVDPDVPFQVHARQLELWIKRSGNCPLSITILFQGSKKHGPGVVTGVDTVIAKILPHVRRWKSIRLHIPAACGAPLWQVLSTGAPCLEGLFVDFCEAGRQNPQLAHVSLCPRLRALRLPTDARLLCTSPVTLQNVQELHVSFTSMDDCFQCLDSCPSVVDIDLILPSNSVDFSICIGQRVRLLPNLQRMRLREEAKFVFIPHRHYTDNPRNNIGLFLDCLRVPSLTYLEIIQPWISQVPHWNHLPSLIIRSQPHAALTDSRPRVEKLTLTGSQIDEHQLVELLGYLPYLKHLIVDELLITEFTLESIITPLDTPFTIDGPGSTGTETHYWLCPNLKKIGIRDGASEKTYGVRAYPSVPLKRWFVFESSIEYLTDQPEQ
ncbi:hypothetical protein BD410DRAFT_900772 [Rickenella mellea]|uniref:Uncharacterized protein n=1 Tax=Rickenella mellea TaxID=50990 RepID=A0A4Y7PU28_9AGAM|nr:hypothetical protein BD410DRAFT_900772 [Rickenella mellea]